MTDLLITGRGPSVRGFDAWDDYGDVMAISSGIFAMPEQHRPPRHFVTMDVPRWYLHGFHDADISGAWQNDWTEPWPFWADERIEKHIPNWLSHRGYYRTLPSTVYDVIPEEHHSVFHRFYMDNMSASFGIQPGWGDYPNVTEWTPEPLGECDFTDDQPIGLKADTGMIRNSWFLGVQVAQRLGYKRIHFIGCDFLDDSAHSTARAFLPKYCRMAADAGLEWINLSPDSELAKYIPSLEVAV